MEDENVPAMLEILSTGLTLQHQAWDSLDAKAGSYLAGSLAITALFVGWLSALESLGAVHKAGLAGLVFITLAVSWVVFRAVRATTIEGIPRVEYLADQISTPRAPTAWALALINACKTNDPRLKQKAERVNFALYLLGGQVAFALAVVMVAML